MFDKKEEPDMINTADTDVRVYRTERNCRRKDRRKFSSIMAMILGVLVTVEILVIGAMVFKLDFHSVDRIALGLGAMVVYSGVVMMLTDK